VLVIVGLVTVFFCVMGGFVAHGGNVAVLVQPTEFLIIGGAAVGALVASCSPALLKQILKQVIHLFTGKGVPKTHYMELLMLLFEIIRTAKTNPLSLEPHVEKPDASEIFKKYPAVLHNHHALHFLCDTLKVQISSPVSPYDLEDLMDADIATAHAEEYAAVTTVSRIGDAMPGLGIVAAVLGVVQTMGKLQEGKEVIGHSVAAALVGTFIGILISYGFVQPMAAKMVGNINEEGKFLEVIKAAMIAYAKDCSPKVCVEFARRTIPPAVRPDFAEVDQASSNLKKAA
jgi:chemotaxis protein MotA